MIGLGNEIMTMFSGFNWSYLWEYQADKPLLFTRPAFWLFFAIVVLVYSLIYRQKRWRHIWLFAVSLYFYYQSGGWYFSLLVVSTLADFFIGLMVYHSTKKWKRKVYLFISLIINIGMLSYFKYAFFFTESFNQLTGSDLNAVNVFSVWGNKLALGDFDTTTIALPVGISFFTFQTISYSVDVYRRKVAPLKNIIDFGFYVSFFPQLVAGPIVRAAEFVPQLHKAYRLTREQFGHALFLIMGGLTKKILISDYISVNFVDRVFDNPLSYSGFENLMAVYGYALQIYCDFSGYTDIAIGVALLLGFRLPVNFFSPYKAVNITDFWRRWHISLSTWLRDYLYIPLGGNRKGRLRMHVNLMITMLLGGLWHGAHWRFVIWGALHGAGLVYHKLWVSFFGNGKRKATAFGHFWRVFLTFQFVSFTWIFFRAKDMDLAGQMLWQMSTFFQFAAIPEIVSGYWKVFTVMALGFTAHWLPHALKERIRGSFIRLPFYAKALICTVLIIIIYQSVTAGLQPFIYFRF
jgi:D-alanyl-lipoteichoic acid acyltransferase DltB (MBOAT superfamily)